MACDRSYEKRSSQPYAKPDLLYVTDWGAIREKYKEKALKRSRFKAFTLAQMERFELSHRLSQSTPLAGEPLEPLGYICLYGYTNLVAQAKLAEREGFEPPVPFDITGFQDQRLKPLGHLSMRNQRKVFYHKEGKKSSAKWRDFAFSFLQ